MKMVTYILWIILFLLLFVAAYLFWHNQSDETFSKIVPSVFVGLVGIIATIFFSAKEYNNQDTFNAVFFINPKTNEILHPENFDLPKLYDETFSPNKSGNGRALMGFSKPINKINGEELFKFYEYVNASLLYQFFVQIRALNQKYESPDFSNISFDENFELKKLKFTHRPLKNYVNIDTASFQGNFHYKPDWNGEPMPEKLEVAFVSTPISASSEGQREMIIYRKKFFEFRVKAEIIESGLNITKGYLTVTLTTTIKFDKLTSQHYLNKVYRGYCQALTKLLEQRLKNDKSISDYYSEHGDWFKN